jgi:hypothetical protein
MGESMEVSTEKRSITGAQLREDYGAIIDKQRREILRLQKQNAAMLQEFRDIEQILGKALHFPWFKDDLVNFPNATEKDGVVVAGPTWELAIHAADKIKILEVNVVVLENELASRDI